MGLRIAPAFILLGLIALIVYLLSFAIEQGEPLLLLAGLALSLLGLLLRRRSVARMKQRSSRFQTVRKLMGWQPEEEE